jgi:hypothetical protein
MRDFGNANLLSAAGTSGVAVAWHQSARCLVQSLTVRMTVSAATLQATLTLKATDFDTKSGAEAVFTGFSVVSALPTGVTYANGVLTINNVGVGTAEVVFTAVAVPRWIGAVWAYTSGGGTVAVDACLSGW